MSRILPISSFVVDQPSLTLAIDNVHAYIFMILRDAFVGPSSDMSTQEEDVFPADKTFS
jgi:hypothetical protein